MNIGVDLSDRSIAIGLNNKVDVDLNNADLMNLIDNTTIQLTKNSNIAAKNLNINEINLIDENNKIKQEFLPVESITNTDNTTITKNEENKLQANNVKLPIYFDLSINKNEWYDSTYIFGESPEDYGKVSVNNYCYYSNWSMTVLNKLDINNNKYKQVFTIDYPIRNSELNRYEYSSGIKEFDFTLPSDIETTFGSNYNINIQDVACVKGLNYNSMFLVLFTISNDDYSLCNLYGTLVLYNTSTKSITQNHKVYFIKSINSKCLISIANKNNIYELDSKYKNCTVNFALLTLDSNSMYSDFKIIKMNCDSTYSIDNISELSYSLVNASETLLNEIEELQYDTLNSDSKYIQYIKITIKDGYYLSTRNNYLFKNKPNSFDMLLYKDGSFVQFSDIKSLGTNKKVYYRYNNSIYLDECTISNSTLVTYSKQDEFIYQIPEKYNYGNIYFINANGNNLYFYKYKDTDGFTLIIINMSTNNVSSFNLTNYFKSQSYSDSGIKYIYTNGNFLKLIGNGIGYYNSKGNYGWFDIELYITTNTNLYLFEDNATNNSIIFNHGLIDIDNNTIYKYGNIYRSAPPIGACYTRYKNTIDPNILYEGTTWELLEIENLSTDISVYKRTK